MKKHEKSEREFPEFKRRINKKKNIISNKENDCDKNTLISKNSVTNLPTN